MAAEWWLDEREAHAWRALQLMQMRLATGLARQLAVDANLSYSDYLVLAALAEQPEGRLRLFELAHHLGWERSRLSHQIGRMVARGLVSKEPCSSDRRGAFVAVTGDGRAQVETAAPGHAAAVRRLFLDRLTPDQLDGLAAAAETVLAALDAQLGAPDGAAVDGPA